MGGRLLLPFAQCSSTSHRASANPLLVAQTSLGTRSLLVPPLLPTFHLICLFEAVHPPFRSHALLARVPSPVASVGSMEVSRPRPIAELLPCA